MRISTRTLSRRSIAAVVGAGLLAAGLVACTPADSTSPNGTTAPTAGASTGEITVFAAASLKGSFTELGQKFEDANPGTTIKFSFAGSSDLATQIVEGAPADVFASADVKNMTKVAGPGLVDGLPVEFATNVLEIAVPKDNPANVSAFGDLANADVKTVICAAEVPCGAATAQLEKSLGVTIKPVSEEASVTDVLGKVSSGEADAGVVYVTDVKAAGDAVTGVPIEDTDLVINTYPIATLKASKNASLAKAFAGFVSGAVGRQVLEEAGFGRPAS